ncbi:MAG: UDP-N-acetylmuramoyl-L-alanyl-D-glutamate--2,6-diaminopimelate ligase [Pseudomonadales bacterium]|nr:UDP-N-acetylmuramoyl-L-alanyl-D-glutamate--2,6-diaminopimelate ligase [Pseudomonadales bacterium]MCP5185354.1 UDP-N-acetylmuramoyl-L-alanyl-D-glutamate--2,6-diaminopimelate ligase [Pseudomonadales bacterium]
MNLRDLLGGDVAELDVSSVTDDSRRVAPGSLFIAVKGHVTDGHGYIADAIARGAVAVVCEQLPATPVSIPCVVDASIAGKRGQIAARLHGEPSEQINCIGVTGTNGKTSVAFHIASMLEALGHPAGYMGTVGWGRFGHLQQTDSTTGGAIVNQERLACLLEAGVRHVAMETSSHALDQGRVDDVRFAAGVFTNLSRDHLDYHADMAAYGSAKRHLFELPGMRLGIINSDDEFGRSLIADIGKRMTVHTFGRKGDITWSHLRPGAAGIRGRWSTPWGQAIFELPLVGEFSVANAAAALGVLAGLGFDLEALVDVQRRMPAVPGRMQFFQVPDGPVVVIDYAHTPDALMAVLSALRRHCKGELICLLGCGGDRDAGKRPMMAAVAEELADVLWFTSDNPRSEDPEAILDDMRAGLRGRGCVYECVDRADAIRRAIACGSSDDMVLVAGKGHEDYQELASGRVPFSDATVVGEIVRQKAYD